ncbi:ATP-binding protein [Fusibacter ferrireducens]|uniref:ATP-binding protein n=1 Tax=Fusibacter ferrireducens TaxID=2785058 RepID=A0ABR9ZXH2_9FIRM|nr:ATP-binding protein [Fusibacter ferrireducens]MBF4695155.1 ATP-binding protein [Fusibacter ferrireducens]
MFIGRKAELNFLEERYESQNGELVVLYGRRRVGKTETLRKFCENKPHVFFACTESPDEQQLTAFSERLLQKGLPVAQYIKRFSDWKLALASILELPNDQKKLLIIDEFPYMVKGNNAIPSILQNLWDEKLKDQNVMIILCGSSMSFIEKEILAEKNPLYGRATGILKMNEMSFYDAIQFVPNYSVFDKITAYAILGGIPHYLKQFDDTLPLALNIERRILTRGSILYSEVEFLMHQELRETATYNVIIEAVALGNTKLNDIHQKTQIEKTKLSVYLKNLMDLGIVTREFPVADGIKAHANIHRGLYQIADQFFRFWYAFVFPNLSELEAGDAKGIWKFVIEPELERHTSYVFEAICRQYLRLKNQKEMLPFHFTKIGRWWNKTDELDIMATDPKKRAFLLGECKYKNSDCTLSDYKNMKEKFTLAGSDQKIYYWLFSKNGFSEELVKIAIEQDVTLVTADNIVKEVGNL